MWTGNDGGIFRSTDSGATWLSMNGDPAATTVPAGKISASQYVSMATHPLDREYMTGGTQDNGTHFKRAMSDTGEWTQIAFGDGGYTAIDQNATDVDNVTVYHTYFNVANGPNSVMEYERVTTTADAKTKSWSNFGCVAGGMGNTRLDCNDSAVGFYAPLVLGPGNPNTVYFGTDSLYRSADWARPCKRSANRRFQTSARKSPPSASLGATITSASLACATAPSGPPPRVPTLWSTSPRRSRPMNTTVNKVLIDPNNTDPNAITAYVTYGGFGNDQIQLNARL